jgi:hypothetical protein
VYEGHVIAETRGARTELVAGSRATLGADGASAVAPDPAAAGSAIGRAIADDDHATREELVARSTQQRAELDKLRARLAELEKPGTAGSADEGRPWHDPSPETLASWVADCHVRADSPGLDKWQPMPVVPGGIKYKDTTIEPAEIPALNAVMNELVSKWRALVRALYVESTGDTAGADTLSLDAMRGELQEKSLPGEHNLLLQQLARERAGLATPPADPSKTSPYERYMRAYLAIGDQTEAAIAKRLGAERAKAIRGDAWGSRSDWSGCPQKH